MDRTPKRFLGRQNDYGAFAPVAAGHGRPGFSGSDDGAQAPPFEGTNLKLETRIDRLEAQHPIGPTRDPIRIFRSIVGTERVYLRTRTGTTLLAADDPRVIALLNKRLSTDPN